MSKLQQQITYAGIGISSTLICMASRPTTSIFISLEPTRLVRDLSTDFGNLV